MEVHEISRANLHSITIYSSQMFELDLFYVIFQIWVIIVKFFEKFSLK